MHVRTRRFGFALPMTILLLLLLMGSVLAAYRQISTHVRELDSLQLETAAFTVAQTGLELYLARSGPLTADTTMRLARGTAHVRATLIRPAMHEADSALYVIRSEGALAGRAARLPEGRRTVAQLAYRPRSQARWSEIPNAWVDSWSTR
jgi:hypothetical protein